MKYQVISELKNPYLTPKETETLALRAYGYSRQQVADMRHRTKSTVNGQMHSILTKLDADNLVAAIAIALVRGILKLEKTLCLAMVVCISMHAVIPSTSYAADLTEKKLPEQPFLRVRVRSGRRRED